MTEYAIDWASWYIPLVPSLIAWWYYKNRTVSSEKRYLTFWPRLWASFVDSIVLWPLGTIFVLILQLDLPLWLFVTVGFLRSLPWMIYNIYLHGTYGQTIGKMVTSVKIIDAKTHNPISFRHAIVRDSIPILLILALAVYQAYHLTIGTISIDEIINNDPSTGAAWFGLILFVWWAAEVVTMLTNRKRRALHDFIAGTVVVRTNIETLDQEE